MAFADAAKYNEVRRMRGLPIGTIVPGQLNLPRFLLVGWFVMVAIMMLTNILCCMNVLVMFMEALQGQLLKSLL